MSAARTLPWGSSRTAGSAGALYTDPGIAEDATSAVTDPNLLCLARCLFLTVPRRRIFFAATGDEVDVSLLCTRLGAALSILRKEKVALVDAGTDSPLAVALKKHSQLNSGAASGQGSSSSRVYRVPAYVLEQEAEQRTAATDFASFGDVLFAGQISDSTAPRFCRLAEACVLVVEANRTHRQAALRAKEILQGWNAHLLGVILSNRTFPVPECIYRRL
jgi:hypothetical protein